MLSCFITWTTVATAFSALLTSLRYIFHACVVREFRAVFYVLIFEIRPTMTVSLLIAKEIFSLNES